MTNADDTQKMLRIIINGQSVFRQEMLGEFKKIDKKIDGVEERLDLKIEKLTQRVDVMGKQLAYLEDDTPTREEFDRIEKRVDKIEQKTAAL